MNLLDQQQKGENGGPKKIVYTKRRTLSSQSQSNEIPLYQKASQQRNTNLSSKPMDKMGSNKKSKRGLTNIPLIKSIVHRVIKRARLEITSLHIHSLTPSGMQARGKIKISKLATGPLPLIGLQIAFKDQNGVSLTWDPSNLQKGVVHAHIDPLNLIPSKSGAASSDINIHFEVRESSHEAFVKFVKHIIKSDPTSGARIGLKSENAEVKLVGLRFGRLTIEKEVSLGGLGNLGGALMYDESGMFGTTSERVRLSDQSQSQKHQTNPYTKGNVQTNQSNSWMSRRKKERPVVQMNTVKQTLPKESQRKDQEPLTIDHLEIVGGDPKDGIQLTASVTIQNPAVNPELSIEPGTMRFMICVRDIEAINERRDSSKRPNSYSNLQIPPGLFWLGSIALENLILRPGPNTVSASGHLIIPSPPADDEPSDSFTARAHRAGQQLIANLMQDEPIENICVIAKPYTNTKDKSHCVSDIPWLCDAFGNSRIEAYIPPLGERAHLLDGAELRVEGGQETSYFGASDRSFDHHSDNNSFTSPRSPSSANLKESVARATLRNGFVGDIYVHNLKVEICSEPLMKHNGESETLQLGSVTSPLTDSPSSTLPWQGLRLSRGFPTHVSLPLEINSDPRVLIEILRKSARMRNIDLGNPLSELLEDLRTAHWNEAGFAEPPQSRPDSSMGNTSRRTSLDDSSAKKQPKNRQVQPSDDLAALLANALGSLRVDAVIEAEVSIGNYRLPGPVNIQQRKLPIALSTATAAALLPLIGKPFVKALVDRAEVDVQHVNIISMDDRGVKARVKLTLSNFGPLSADATFEEGLRLRDPDDVSKTIAIIYFDSPLSVTAGDETPIITDVHISPSPGSQGQERFSQFVGNLLNADTITFSALADPLSITTGGVHFNAVLEKMITVAGLGGFGSLRLEDLQITGETAAPAAGVSISVAAPTASTQPTAIAISTIARIHNSGDVQLKIAKLEVAIMKDDIQIGQAMIDDVDLKARSVAHLKVKGVLYAPQSREEELNKAAIEKLNKLISTLLSGKEAKVVILGRRAWVPTSKSNRPVSLAWLDASLRMFQTDAIIQWKGGVQIVEKIDVGKVEATFAARKPLQLKIDDIVVQYSVPFPIQFDLQSIEATMNILFENKKIARCHAAQDSIEHIPLEPIERPPQPEQRSGRSNTIAAPNISSSTTSSSASNRVANSPLLRKSVTSTSGVSLSGTGTSRSNAMASSPTSLHSSLPRYPSTSSIATSSNAHNGTPAFTGRVKLSLKAFELDAKDNEELIGKMVTHIFEAGEEATDRITLSGEAHVKVKTALGILTLTVPLGAEHKLELIGLDGLRKSPISYTDFTIESANPQYILISLNVQSHNPAENVTLHVPDSSLTLGVYYQDAFIGDVILGGDGKGITIRHGPVAINGVQFRYRPTEKSEGMARKLLSRLFTGEACQLAIRGHKRSSINWSLAQALRLVDVPIEIQPLGQGKILDLIKVQLGMSVLTSNSIDATYFINNPIGLPIDVLHLEVRAFYQSNPFGQATKTYYKEGVLTGKASDGTPASQMEGIGGGSRSTPNDEGGRSHTNADASRRTSTSSGNPRLQRLLLAPHVRKFRGALVVKLNQPLDQLVKAFLKERGSIVLDVELRVKMDIQGYVLPAFEYRQQVPLEVHGLQGVASLLRLM